MLSTSPPVCAVGGAAVEQEPLHPEERNATGLCLQACSPLLPGGVLVLGILFSAYESDRTEFMMGNLRSGLRVPVLESWRLCDQAERSRGEGANIARLRSNRLQPAFRRRRRFSAGHRAHCGTGTKCRL
ncbi:unnamed protein product [Rangifer tarandus platyrhynchus]|uniref:Uncharacterized protein n=1 Tax=Rangifer tarandus platyrhynchus TaxID=3082113 RepID=A0AC60A6M8_RANTA